MDVVVDDPSALHRKARRLVKKVWFEWIIIGFIVLSLVPLLFTHVDNPSITTVLYIIDVFFTLVFLLEAVIKIYALGFYQHRDSYIRDLYNVLDFAIVLVSLLIFVPSIFATRPTVIRLIRVIRPIRSLRLFTGLRFFSDIITYVFPAVGGVLFFPCRRHLPLLCLRSSHVPWFLLRTLYPYRPLPHPF
ncbi:hypothetical protein GEMRC1_008927 [Eukaryota sp. GEM-RC1]